MVHPSQSAFIKDRFIEDNFRFVQASARLLHAGKFPRLLIKVNISRAFDSVAWPFLHGILQNIRFTRVWRDWISTQLSTASTRLVMNGVPGDKISHARGLRQGDMLSPFLFLLVMVVLSALIRKVDEWSLFSPLSMQVILFRASLYTDDLIMFISPVPQDLQRAKEIFNTFQNLSGLGCNMQKSQLAPIRCNEGHLHLATSLFPCQIT
jgi:hypothetical protein